MFLDIIDKSLPCVNNPRFVFAHVDLNVPEGILVENVHLSESLMKLSYNLNQQD
jgi:redox-sensing transcriptional repressor